METIYLICAAVGGTLIVCQFLMTLFGLGGGHDMADGHHFDGGGHDVGGGHDAAGDHHAGHHHDESTWFLGILTFRTISAGLAFFGLIGVIGQRSELEMLPTLVAATVAGLAAVFFVAWIMRFLGRLNIDGTVRIERALGCRGNVYIPIPGGAAGQGKVQVSVLNRTVEYKATAKDALPTGAKIVVVGIHGSDTVEVAPATD